METLINILKKFDDNRKKTISEKEKTIWEKKSLKEKYEAIAGWFMPCAEELLCKGYFLINGKYIIDLGAIELYYHEEEGEIKDYIMYHIKDKVKSKIKDFENELPYFEFGSFNLHQSGVDVTFENKENKYRASFLIRSYRVLKTENGLYPKNDKTKYDPHSTHIFDDMFYSGYGNTEIVWIPTDKKEENVELCPRVNVADYLKDENGKYVKQEIKSKDAEYNVAVEESKKNDPFSLYFKSSSKIYKRDMRKWQFKLRTEKK